MPTLVGPATPVEVPAQGDSELSAMTVFGRASTLITDELLRRQKAKAEHRPWVQGVTYQLLGTMITNGFSGLFEKRIRNFDRKLSSDQTELNPFQIGLLATFAHHMGAMGETERSYFGPRLWYAYRHYVPHEFLGGFLHQVWTKGAQHRASDGYIEPDFALWVAMNRAVDPSPENRGQYPAAIEKMVAQIRAVSSTLR